MIPIIYPSTRFKPQELASVTILLISITGLAEVTFFPDRLELYRKTCLLPGPVAVTGKVTEHLCSINIEALACPTAA